MAKQAPKEIAQIVYRDWFSNALDVSLGEQARVSLRVAIATAIQTEREAQAQRDQVLDKLEAKVAELLGYLDEAEVMDAYDNSTDPEIDAEAIRAENAPRRAEVMGLIEQLRLLL